MISWFKMTVCFCYLAFMSFTTAMERHESTDPFSVPNTMPTFRCHGSAQQEAFGLIPVANSFSYTLNPLTQGLISGFCEWASVNAHGTFYHVRIKVGPQIFESTTANPLAGTGLPLVSTTDNQNVIVLEYDADNMGIQSAEIFQSCLQRHLGVDSNAPSRPAKFISLCSYTASVSCGAITLEPGPSTSFGVWALQYQGAPVGGTGYFRLSSGVEHCTLSIPNVSDAAMAQEILFTNGVKMKLTNEFIGTVGIPRAIFHLGYHS